MRPSRLELSGFASFREPVTVDFDDADLFALVGQTGAGKSSLVDAMVFALYGQVPRHEKGAVERLISAGRNEARVRLDFTAGDKKFRAARVIARTESGGRTKEARLEIIGASGEVEDILAGRAKEMGPAIEAVVGLDYTQFCRSVVLPQGRFAELLHAESGDRQLMLERLLGFDEIEGIRAAAKAREQAAGARGDIADADVKATAWGSDAVATLEGREVMLRALREELVAATDGYLTAKAAADAHTPAIASAELEIRTLAAIPLPDDVEARGVAALDAARALESAQDAVGKAKASSALLHRQQRDTPVAQFRAWLEQHDEREQLTARLEKGLSAIADQQAVLQTIDAELAAAATATELARNRVRTAEREDMAAALSAGLALGEPCPVCGTAIDHLRSHDATDLADARTTAESCVAAERDLRTRSDHARGELLRFTTHAENVEERMKRITSELDGAPSPAELVEAIADHDALGARLEEATRNVANAEEVVAAARAEMERHVSEVAQMVAAVRSATVLLLATLGDLAPAVPEPDPSSLDASHVDVDALARWAATVREVQRHAVDDRSARLDEMRHASAELVAEAERHERSVAVLVERVASLTGGRADPRSGDAGSPGSDAGQLSGPARSLTVLDAAIIDAAAELAAAADAVERHRKASADSTALRREAALARELATLLDAKHFRRWMLQEALVSLAAGASVEFGNLSGGQFSLELSPDGASFVIIDHANADEVRSARSLSGGETFLASLALALALAEQIAAVSARGAAHLDALFVDEGFGSLDADTLDVVATALESLGQRGRMVGIITHVPELAERMPVRFEVARSATTTVVRRDR